MVLMIRTTILFCLLVAAGCGPKPLTTIPSQPSPRRPGSEALKHAEQAFENGFYRDALDGYNAYLRFTDGDSGALYQIGKIYRIIGRSEDAHAVFARLIREYPQRPQYLTAISERLAMWHAAGQYEEIVTHTAAYSEKILQSDSSGPILIQIADAYTALGEPMNAAGFYLKSWEKGPDEIMESAWNGLQQSVGQLSAEEMQLLIAQVEDRRAMGLLLYQLGMALILDEKYDDALDVLDSFVARFPEHAAYQDASQMVETLRERSRFNPYTIGCVLPLSGPYAIYGQRALNGIELAFSEFGGADNDLPYRIFVEDSQSDPIASEKAVDALDRQKVGAILGPMALSAIAATTAQSKGIPIIVFTQREGIPDIGPYVFRNFITPTMQVHALVSYAVNVLGANRFAILYPNENYGKRYMNLFWDQVVEHEGVVNGVERYDPEATDFAEPIKKLTGLFYKPPRSLFVHSVSGLIGPPETFAVDPEGLSPEVIADPIEEISGLLLDRDAIDDLNRRNREDEWHPVVDFDAVFIPDAPKKAGLIIPQLAYYDVRDVHLIGTNLWNSKTLLDMSSDYMQYALSVDGFFAEGESQKVKEFVAAFEHAFGRVPGIIEAAAYDSAMMVLQTMMRHSETDSRRDLKTALLELDSFEGVSGRTHFRPNGEADKELQILKIHQRHFVPAEAIHAHPPTDRLQ